MPILILTKLCSGSSSGRSADIATIEKPCQVSEVNHRIDSAMLCSEMLPIVSMTWRGDATRCDASFVSITWRDDARPHCCDLNEKTMSS